MAERLTVTNRVVFASGMRIKSKREYTDPKPAGLALSPDGQTLYAALVQQRDGRSREHALPISISSAATRALSEAHVEFEIPVGSSPESLALSSDGKRLYVANRGGRAPQVGDQLDDDDPVVVDPDTGKANTGTVSVIDPFAPADRPASYVIANIAVRAC